MAITKHHWTIIIMVMISFFFLFLDGYYLQVKQTQNSKQNDVQRFTQGFMQISGEYLEFVQTAEASVYEDLPKWLPGCEKIFLDLGANIGVTVKKLFEPENYPKSPALLFFDKSYGHQWLHESINRFPKRLCALGFEPNPKHQKRLKELEARYSQKNWNVHFFPLAVSNGNGNVTFYTTDNCPVSFLCVCVCVCVRARFYPCVSFSREMTVDIRSN